ncbi:hypothetical protein [Sphingomonas sp. 37zxx]|uniref:hypothetical protein n=1 Tax=Sphingomonas sp. 37zxx TaxID=1550073 RepID=UPI0012DFEE6D|nr:hypothetical protein [Sphingomonas sp. 37zxx]
MTDDTPSKQTPAVASRPTATALGAGPGYSGQEAGTHDRADIAGRPTPALAPVKEARSGGTPSGVDLRDLPPDAGWNGADMQGTGEVHGSGAGAGGGNPGEDYDSDTGGDQSEGRAHQSPGNRDRFRFSKDSMMSDKQPMQASGAGTSRDAPDGVSDAKISGKTGSESDGAAYPNPHTGKDGNPEADKHGGQTEIAYHGPGQLGEQKVGETKNAVAESN